MNNGGGVKIKLAGPLRVRLDYRVFTLRGSPRASPVTGCTPARTWPSEPAAYALGLRVGIAIGRRPWCRGAAGAGGARSRSRARRAPVLWPAPQSPTRASG